MRKRDELKKQLLELPDKDRHHIYKWLGEFEPAPDWRELKAIEDSWMVEIKRRQKEIQDGKDVMIPWEEVKAEIDAMLDGHRKYERRRRKTA